MFAIRVKNEYGEMIDFSQSWRKYQITNVDGLGPVEADINTTTVANNDGGLFASSRVLTRELVLTIAIEAPAEENRINLYRYFRPKKKVQFFFQNNTRNVYIEGYVKSAEIALFEQKQAMQVTIECPQPYFKNIDEFVCNFSALENLFEFPFAIEEEGIPFSELTVITNQIIENNGDVETGMIIEFSAKGALSNPTIYNVDTREQFGVLFDMVSGDKIIINTQKGEKSVYLLRDGEKTNIMNKIKPKPDWLQLSVGGNIFTFSCDSGIANLDLTVRAVDKFGGV